MILFCVCLAHARQQGLGTPVATGVAFQNSYPVTGKILSATTNEPLDGATISIQGKQTKVLTNANGAFRILASDTSGVLLISFVGYQSAEINFNRREAGPFTILLESNGTQLEEVEVSTGYQTLPKERATGSFVQINNELLNRSISTNILDRLDGVTSGLIFNKNPESRSPITVRGNSSIFGNQEPLVVLDNFPYDGPLENINPNDIESITVLKDAAAASIWGVRAGNGVIVVTSKKGVSGKPTVKVVSNITLAEKPDIYAQPQLSSSQFVELERFLFDKGHYWNIADGYSAISPVVDILNRRRSGLISSADSAQAIDALKTMDVRDDLSRHVYRSSLNRQHALSVQGGGIANTYFLSAGYDGNDMNIVSNSMQRINLTAKNSLQFLNNRISLATDFFFTQKKSKLNPNSYTTARYPYEQLLDGEGRSMAIVRDFRSAYLDTVGRGRLLDWHYRPLSELEPIRQVDESDYRLNVQLRYRLIEGLDLSAHYLYQKGLSRINTVNAATSYYTRNLINSYSQLGEGNEVTRPVPLGDIVDKGSSDYHNNAGRVQINFNKTFNNDHAINFLAGVEIREYKSFSDNFRLYGYNAETATNANAAIDFTQEFPMFYGWSSARIPAMVSSRGALDRNRSFFANGSYTLKQRYTLSASARRDESNLFGVKANQKGVPLWSIGGLWDLSRESFYNWDWLPALKIRTSYGYNGNIDKSVTAYLTALAGTGINALGMNYLSISNPPNPSLRWEKVGIWNAGIDFTFRGNRLSGSIEYYDKKSSDLIANSPLSPQTGRTAFRGNAADMRTNGLDLQLNSVNLRGELGWTSTLLFNFVKDKITSYKLRQGNNLSVVSGNYVNPLEGYPLYAIFSFPFKGLDAAGNPIGELQGEESLDYAAITTNAEPSNLIYNGTATPVYFGSLINTFSYGNFSLSVNVVFKAGHYFRRLSLNYSELPGNYRQPDYSLRWQQPGDELHTNVPALMYPFNTARESFYKYSDVLVENAGSVRIQDVRITYRTAVKPIGLNNLELFSYASNLGILWRANRSGLDPDSPVIPIPRTIAFGLTAHF